MNNILIVEDDVQLSLFIDTVLQKEGYQTKVTNCGQSGLDELKKNDFSLILLDLNLPDDNGINICQKIREYSDIPIIIFTSVNQLKEKVEGFDAGANDYIVKPVEIPELLARVRTQLRVMNQLTNEKIISFADLKVNLENREVYRNKENIKLSPREFEILEYFIINQNKSLSKEQIFNDIFRNSDKSAFLF